MPSSAGDSYDESMGTSLTTSPFTRYSFISDVDVKEEEVGVCMRAAKVSTEDDWEEKVTVRVEETVAAHLKELREWGLPAAEETKGFSERQRFTFKKELSEAYNVLIARYWEVAADQSGRTLPLLTLDQVNQAVTARTVAARIAKNQHGR